MEIENLFHYYLTSFPSQIPMQSLIPNHQKLLAMISVHRATRRLVSITKRGEIPMKVIRSPTRGLPSFAIEAG